MQAEDGPVNTGRLLRAQRLLRRVPGHAIAHAVGELLVTEYGASAAELFLIDYRIARLAPALDRNAETLPLSTSRAGSAVRERRTMRYPAEGRHEVYAPMRAAGGVLGVLTAFFAEQPADELCAELGDLAATVGEAIAVADTVTDTFHRVRRSRRLTLAAEMQWGLLPGRGLTGDEFDLAGQLEPAYRVRGDTFDWSVDAEHVTLTVIGGMGEGADAALLSSLTVNAMRNARRAGLPPAEQVSLADQAVWAQHGGAQHASVLSLRVELATGVVRLVDAGSPRVWLAGTSTGEDGRELELDKQLPAGMFADTRYTEQELTLRPGDRLLVLSDGVFEAMIDKDRYADRSLPRVLRSMRLQPAGEAVRTVISDLLAFHGSTEINDDAVVVCLDWFGREDAQR